MLDAAPLMIAPGASLTEAMHIIDRNAGMIALIVDEERHLLGTLSDGDIRRALLQGANLDTSVGSVMHRTPAIVSTGTSPADAFALMRRKALREIPVVDAAGRVVGIHTMRDITRAPQLDNPVVIMAGGLGIRLRPLTETRPKPMLEVGSRPLLQIMIERLASSGFHRFYLATNYLAETIIDHFGDGSKFGVTISYLREDRPLGTAGALSLLPEKPEQPILVMNGDILTKAHFPQMVQFHQQHDAAITMGVREYEIQVPYGVVEVSDGNIVKIEEKPHKRHLINSGIYVLSPEMLNFAKKNEPCDMTQLLRLAFERRARTLAYQIHEFWMDIGHLDDFERANRQYAELFPPLPQFDV